MRDRRLIPSLFLIATFATFAICAVTAAATAPPAPSAAPAPTTRRIDLIGPDGKVFPYSVEIPVDWQVVPDPEKKGLWLAPAGVDPGKDPRSVFVRPSPADLRKPEETVRSIQENDKKDDTWAAPLVAVRLVGTTGTRGILVQMDSGKGASARSLLVLKLPVGPESVDLMGVAPRALFAALRPAYEKILFSVQPVLPAGK
ncbi:MAG: hypothetical protein QOJ16_769 [Acidobacteriota bacterium]|nr:hypothetical protein [Acidobacteriota bacterium]